MRKHADYMTVHIMCLMFVSNKAAAEHFHVSPRTLGRWCKALHVETPAQRRRRERLSARLTAHPELVAVAEKDVAEAEAGRQGSR